MEVIYSQTFPYAHLQPSPLGSSLPCFQCEVLEDWWKNSLLNNGSGIFAGLQSWQVVFGDVTTHNSHRLLFA